MGKGHPSDWGMGEKQEGYETRKSLNHLHSCSVSFSKCVCCLFWWHFTTHGSHQKLFLHLSSLPCLLLSPFLSDFFPYLSLSSSLFSIRWQLPSTTVRLSPAGKLRSITSRSLNTVLSQHRTLRVLFSRRMCHHGHTIIFILQMHDHQNV